MSTAASAIPAVLAQLGVLARATFGTSSPVEVFVGPTNSQDDTMQQLWIGISDENVIAEGATSTQYWPYASNSFRREELTIHCKAVAWNGDDDFTTALDQAMTQVQVFTAAAVADASLASTVLFVESAAENLSVSWGYNNTGGAQAEVRFDVTAKQMFQG